MKFGNLLLHPTHFPMLKNYLLTTWRNIKRNPLYAGINILGLSLGIAASLLLWQYVIYERSYDQYHEDKAHIYRVRLDRYDKGELSTQWAAGSAAVGNVLKDKFPEVEAYTKLHARAGVFKFKDKVHREDKAYFANASAIEMFSLDILQGDAFQGMQRPSTVIISQEIAGKYFGDENPIGKILTASNSGDLEVVGVFADLPPNTHLDFNILISHPTMVNQWGEEVETAMQWDGFLTYVKLKLGTDPQFLAQQLNGWVAEDLKEELEASQHRMDFSFQPIASIHFTSNYLGEFKPNGDGKTVKFLSLIGILIIFIAWINYINLSTARAADRGKEVGVRKTNGAIKKHLITQFLVEALVINLVAALIGLSVYQLAKPLLHTLAQTPTDFSLWQLPLFIPLFLLIIFLGAILSGLYPAFVLASFKPVNAIKGYLNLTRFKSSFSISQTQLRRGLVIFQFTASIILIAATFTIYRQLTYMQTYDKGVDITQTVVVNGPGVVDSTLDNRLQAFLENIEQIPGVIHTSTSSTVPGITYRFNVGGLRLWGADQSEGKQYDRQWINPDYLDLYGIEMVAGSNFSDQPYRDSTYALFNEEAVRHLGFDSPEEVIGKQINQWGDRLTIKGVVKDYFHRSLKQSPLPIVYRYYPYCRDYLSIKVEEAAIAEVMPAIQEQYTRTFPGNPYDYFFNDEKYGQLYQTEMTSGKIFSLFSLLAVVVACLGLFGLISYALMRRTKEIGIRKVLGASHQHILRLLLRDFSYLILFAGILAIPFSYWAITSWLKSYPYRIPLQLDLFLVPIIIVMGLALITILRTMLVSAQAKPVDALRME